VAAGRVTDRAVQDAAREPDAYEADNGLQARTLAAYRALADAQWTSPWLELDNSGDRGALDAQIAELADAVESVVSEDAAAGEQ
jgi:dTMP kinase